ncbi:MAG: hypothetical protein RBS91_08465 [Sulfurimonadaceae bacterium]|jgi:hypothetical protein|nr:hypothetical protein [Sulfurimonadaceae bacterium]
MARMDWIIITFGLIATLALGFILSVYYVKEYVVPEVKTISLMSILNDSEDPLLIDYSEGKITQEQFEEQVKHRIEKTQEAMEYFTTPKDILLIEESVVKTSKNNTVSITEAVKNYVK